MGKYNFDEIIERRNTNALNTDGFRSYIFGATDDDSSMKFPYEDDEFVRMWVADMEFATPDCVLDKIRERLDKRILGYTRIFSDEYYNAFKSWCERRYEWSFEKEELLTSNGIIPALYALTGHILEDDEKVLFLTPSYAYFQYSADVNGNEAVYSDLINNDGYFEIDYEDFAKKASDEKTNLLIFCNPHNPTGRVWRKEELEKLAKIIEENNLWVISDEIHCDLLRKDQKHIPLGKIMPNYERLVTCMAISKTFNTAGLMFSNILIRDEGLRNKWKEKHYNFENPLSIAGALGAYESGDEWLEELRDYLDSNFKVTEEYLKVNLPKAKFKISEATYLAWVDLSEYFKPEDDLSEFFAYKAGVLLEGGRMFVQNSDCFIRLNLAMPKEMLLKGLERISESIKKKVDGQ